jgi:hypothetical protein
MKSIILCSLIAIVGLFTAGTLSSFDTNTSSKTKFVPQWNEGPCIDGSSLVGKITGIGNGLLTIEITGQVSCDNPGDNKPPAWQNFSKSVNLKADKNGNLPVNISLSLCKSNWTQTAVNNVQVTVYQFGQVAIPTTNAPACN